MSLPRASVLIASCLLVLCALGGPRAASARVPHAASARAPRDPAPSDVTPREDDAALERVRPPLQSPPAERRTPIPRRERTQYILMGMDTTPHWQRRGFEDLFHYLNTRTAEGEPAVSYTLFIGSGGMQFDERRRGLSEAERAFQGVPPRHNPVFDYAESMEQIRGKIENIRRLHELGVEIGSHTVRHERGSEWTAAEWEHEIADHERILDLVHLPHPVGFRAPFLATNEHMFTALVNHHYRYDSSRTANSRVWPIRYPGTDLWQFGVPSVMIPGRDRPALLYDLNLEQRLRRAAVASGASTEAEIVAFMDDAFYRAIDSEFRRRFRGARAPFLLSGHGGFRDPITRFMRHVCHMEHVRCATFREVVEFMDAHPEMEGAN